MSSSPARSLSTTKTSLYSGGIGRDSVGDSETCCRLRLQRNPHARNVVLKNDVILQWDTSKKPEGLVIGLAPLADVGVGWAVRGREADVRPETNPTFLSKKHARVKWDLEREEFTLEDLSTNGTCVNHVVCGRSKKVALEDCCIITLGIGSELRPGEELDNELKLSSMEYEYRVRIERKPQIAGIVLQHLEEWLSSKKEMKEAKADAPQIPPIVIQTARDSPTGLAEAAAAQRQSPMPIKIELIIDGSGSGKRKREAESESRSSDVVLRRESELPSHRSDAISPDLLHPYNIVEERAVQMVVESQPGESGGSQEDDEEVLLAETQHKPQSPPQKRPRIEGLEGRAPREDVQHTEWDEELLPPLKENMEELSRKTVCVGVWAAWVGEDAFRREESSGASQLSSARYSNPTTAHHPPSTPEKSVQPIHKFATPQARRSPIAEIKPNMWSFDINNTPEKKREAERRHNIYLGGDEDEDEDGLLPDGEASQWEYASSASFKPTPSDATIAPYRAPCEGVPAFATGIVRIGKKMYKNIVHALEFMETYWWFSVPNPEDGTGAVLVKVDMNDVLDFRDHFASKPYFFVIRTRSQLPGFEKFYDPLSGNQRLREIVIEVKSKEQGKLASRAILDNYTRYLTPQNTGVVRSDEVHKLFYA